MGKRKHASSGENTGADQRTASFAENDVIDLADDTPTPPGEAAELTTTHVCSCKALQGT